MGVKIIVFTLNGCGHCHDLKTKLNSASIPYQDIEITKNKSIWDQVVSQTGHNLLPTIFVQKDEDGNGPVYIPGQDFNNGDEAIKLINEHLGNKL
jgi:glutaredoxin